MVSAADIGIVAVSIVATLLGLGMLASGQILAFGPLLLGVLGFVYLKTDSDPIDQWLNARDGASTDTEVDALTVLRRRYARGELDQAEFERRLDDLLETETVEQATNHREETPITERSQ